MLGRSGVMWKGWIVTEGGGGWEYPESDAREQGGDYHQASRSRGNNGLY